MTYLLVGLGNPDTEYENTRHNAGRLALDYVREKKHLGEWKVDKMLKADVLSAELAGKKVTLMKPNTFMNKSGLSLKPIITSEKKAESLVVLYDDLDLPIGTFKISFNRGSGGHKGVESVIRSIGTKAFIRVRIGICPTTAGGKLRKPKGETEVVDFILGKFKKSELEVLEKTYKKITEALEMLVTDGKERMMGSFN